MPLTAQQERDVYNEIKQHIFDVSPDQYDFESLALFIIKKLSLDDEDFDVVGDFIINEADKVYKQIKKAETTGIIATDNKKKNEIVPKKRVKPKIQFYFDD